MAKSSTLFPDTDERGEDSPDRTSSGDDGGVKRTPSAGDTMREELSASSAGSGGSGSSHEGEDESSSRPDSSGSEVDSGSSFPAGDSDSSGSERRERVDGESPSFLDQLEGLGFQDLKDEEEARQRLLDSYQQTVAELDQRRSQEQQLSQLAAYGNEFLRLQNDPAYQNYLAQQEQLVRGDRNGSGRPGYSPSSQGSQGLSQVQDPSRISDSGEPRAWWNPPEVNESWAKEYITTDPETGQQVFKENTPASIRASLENYQTHIRDWTNKLLYNPPEALTPAIEQIAQPMIERAFQEWETRNRNRATVEEINAQHGDWMYRRDPRTNDFVRGADGGPELTPEGRKVVDYMEAARQMGIQDPMARWRYGVDQFRLELLSSMVSQQDQASEAQETAEKKKMEHLQRGASRVPSRGGSARQPVKNQAQNENLSAAELFRQEARAAGLI